jgi:hypothetical protein
VVIDPGVLMVKSMVENTPSEGMGREHPRNEGFEFDVSMIELFWNRAL